jgi:shikimate dehydrogenase
MKKNRLLFGLIGFPLGHSFSATWFNKKFILAGDTGKEYRLFPLQTLHEFPALLAGFPELTGLNVTIPYKEAIIPFLDEIDETARLIGAVNTIRITRANGIIRTKGFNTDAPAFLQTLSEQIPEGDALILGTGGASRAVAYALKEKNRRFSFVSRNKTRPGIITYEDLTRELIREHRFIINTTPMGMYPETDRCPSIPYQFLTADHFLYDLIYNPEVTRFMSNGNAMQARTMNGMQMFYNQAELAFNIFVGCG